MAQNIMSTKKSHRAQALRFIYARVISKRKERSVGGRNKKTKEEEGLRKETSAIIVSGELSRE